MDFTVHLTILQAAAMGNVFKEQGLNKSKFMPHTYWEFLILGE